MQIRITESQLSRLEDSRKMKKMIFKYWDITKPGLSSELFKLFSLDNRNNFDFNILRHWLIEYLGVDNVKKNISKYLNNKTFGIHECGGYNFEFTVDKYSFIDGEYGDTELELVITIDDVNGTVALIMIDGEILNLRDAINNEEFGWEIRNETEDCILDFLDKNILEKYGVRSTLRKSSFKSNSN